MKPALLFARPRPGSPNNDHLASIIQIKEAQTIIWQIIIVGLEGGRLAANNGSPNHYLAARRYSTEAGTRR